MIKLIYAERKNPDLSLGSRRLAELNKKLIRVMELAQLSLSTRFPACTLMRIPTNIDSNSLYKRDIVIRPSVVLFSSCFHGEMA